MDFKYIAEPSMHSMPAVALHPNSKFLLTSYLVVVYLNFGRKGTGRVCSMGTKHDGNQSGKA